MRASYLYSDEPADDGRLKQALGAAQVALTSRPLNSNGLLVRFGGALTGGYEQATIKGGVVRNFDSFTPSQTASTAVDGVCASPWLAHRRGQAAGRLPRPQAGRRSAILWEGPAARNRKEWKW